MIDCKHTVPMSGQVQKGLCGARIGDHVCIRSLGHGPHLSADDVDALKLAIDHLASYPHIVRVIGRLITADVGEET